MYIFYGDESGFSKGGNLEPAQPITVFAGILIDRTKLFKAIRVFDTILADVNKGVGNPVKELKFNEIKQGQYPYSINFPKVDDKADLLERVIRDFCKGINFDVLYCAIDDDKFFKQKKTAFANTGKLTHPYLCAVYRVISRIEQHHSSKKNNKGKTFVILDEQSIFQRSIEELITSPLHCTSFTQIIDTTYFGKSHYSKLIQIADLIAGIIRFHLCNCHLKKAKNHFSNRIEQIYNLIIEYCVSKECFNGDLKTLYKEIEIKIP